jgi:ABC-type phosphate transport system substrate-binding protein
MDELKAIFSAENTGKVVRWSQVRANIPDSPLTVVSLDPRSGTTAFFTGTVTGLRGFVRPDAKVTANHADVIRMVAADPNAIGFVSMGALAESKAAVWRVPLNFGHGPVLPAPSRS